MSKNIIISIVILFLLWQISFIILSLVSIKVFPIKNEYLGIGRQAYDDQFLLFSRLNFDGNHYYQISTNEDYGYSQQAFFPLYPLVVNIVSGFSKNFAMTGITISLVSFLVSLFNIYWIASKSFGKKAGIYTIVCLVTFPTSFIFGLFYSESLFLFLITTSIVLNIQKRHMLSAIIGSFGSMTRMIGITLLSLIKINRVKEIFIYLSIVPLGLLTFMVYLLIKQNDPFAFINIQKNFGQNRSSFTTPPQVIYRYNRMLVHLDYKSTNTIPTLLELGTSMIIVSGVVRLLVLRRFSWAVWCSVCFLIPTSTGTWLSMGRFILTMFPIFIVFGEWCSKSRVFLITYLFFAIPIYTILSMLFVTGHWIV